MHSSASRPIRAIQPGGATGTASTTRRAPWARATWQAARAVEPVAMPSSTITAVRPASAVRGRSPRNRWARRSSSARSRASTAASSDSEVPAMRSISSLMIRIPSSPMAPMPSSGWNGTPSLRTTITSKGASSDRATSNATGTPPRGRPSTTTCSSRRCWRRSARRRPASKRSAKNITASSPVDVPPNVLRTPGPMVLSRGQRSSTSRTEPVVGNPPWRSATQTVTAANGYVDDCERSTGDGRVPR